MELGSISWEPGLGASGSGRAFQGHCLKLAWAGHPGALGREPEGEGKVLCHLAAPPPNMGPPPWSSQGS